MTERIEIMDFEKLDTPSLREVFKKAMLEKILSGELKPGDRLPSERELAKQMGISRSSVNQGIVELEGKGFLEVVPRRGTFICDYRKNPTPQTLEAVMSYGCVELEYPLFSDLMDTRMLLEKECAKLACTKAEESTLEEMQNEIDELKAGGETFIDHLFQFHYLLTVASGNMVYSMIYKGFEPVLRCLMAEHYKESSDIDDTVEIHQKFIEAINEGNEEMAVQFVTEILNEGTKALRKNIFTDRVKADR